MLQQQYIFMTLLCAISEKPNTVIEMGLKSVHTNVNESDLITIVTCRAWFGASLSSRTAAAIAPVLCLCCVIDSVASCLRYQVLICRSL